MVQFRGATGARGVAMRSLLLALLLSLAVLTGCGGGGSPSGGGQPTLVSINITPANPTIASGATQQFTVTGTYSDGTTKPLSGPGNWQSSNTSVATINSSGLATAVSSGTTTISVSSGTISGSTVLTVANALKSIAVTPATATVAPNGTQQFTATGTFADGSTQDITSSVTWSASTGATVTQNGLATGVTPGSTATIMAAQGSVSGAATLTVSNPLVSIALTGPTAPIHVGTKPQFIATGTYADGTTNVITSSVTWASSNTAVATISNSPGTQGLVTGVAAGTTSITATLGSVVSPPVGLTVSSSPLVSIAVTPPNAALVYLSPQQYTATGRFQDGTTQDITNVSTWSSSDTSKISITVSGVATGVGTTSTAVTITATDGSVSGSTTATVVPPVVVSIKITPGTVDLAQGTGRQYTARATLSDGATLNVTAQATWASSDTTLATVGTHSGFVQAVTSAPGPSNPVNITASYSGVTQTQALNVTNATPQTITVSPISATVPVGVPERFAAIGAFSDGTTQDISVSSTWTSSDTTVAGVTLGTATGLKPGAAAITASFGGVTSPAAQLTISSATLQRIAITPGQTILAPASTVAYQAVGTYSDQTTQFISGLVTWASSANKVATINTSGIATGQSAGTAMITAAYQGVTSNTANVLVTASPLVSIAVAPALSSVPATIPFGVSLQFAATGRFADGSTENLTNSVTWATGTPSVATVTNAAGQPGQQGLVTGIVAGTSSVTAVFAGIQGSDTLTVTNATISQVSVSPLNQTASAGTQLQFTATGTFSDNSTVSLTSQVAWSSSVVTVATINGSGLANTVAPGTTSIIAAFTQDGQQPVKSPPATLTVH